MLPWWYKMCRAVQKGLGWRGVGWLLILTQLALTCSHTAPQALGLAAVKACVCIVGIIAGGRLFIQPLYKKVCSPARA